MEWFKSKCPDWLIVKKCCFCVPIRKGLTIFGYVNLPAINMTRRRLYSSLLVTTTITTWLKCEKEIIRKNTSGLTREKSYNEYENEYFQKSLLKILSLLSFPLLIFMLVEHLTSEEHPETDHVLLDPSVNLPLSIAFVVIDAIMTVVMIIGAHKKNQLLLKIYFYFGVVFQLVTLCVDLICFDYREYVENVVFVLILCLNIYLLFLVYNTIHLIEESTEVQYIAYQDHQQRV